ncbi:hypothetical protein BDQ17DRAFT_1334186 [Cyathus striatus]|nr:hypothetical protein BDQ17DRAFT_1334186 [Cyathus striatus]
MTALIERLPGIKDLGVSIVGEKCYHSLVENLNVNDIECIKHSLSKGLGLGVVVGGSIVKLPQILLIIKARSARGLSLPSYMLETLSYSINLIYSLRHNFPISTYGETFFLTLQNTLITLLIIVYSPTTPTSPSKASIIAAGEAPSLHSYACAVASCYGPLGLIAKLPQIMKNAETKETGQLSALVILAQVLGGIARLFTTLQDVGDWIVAASYGMAILLNLVLLAQVLVYGGKKSGAPVVVKKEVLDSVQEEKEKGSASGVQVSAQQTQPTLRTGSPPPVRSTTPSSKTSGPSARPSTPGSRAGTPTGGRKWARKVD